MFPEKNEANLEVIDAEKLKVGDGQYLNAYHKLKDDGKLSKLQQVILDDNIYSSYLEKGDATLTDCKQINKKRDLQKVGMEIM